MFAQNMRALRRSRRMTQAQLGELLGLSASAVGMYEQGRREPELSVIKKLCQIFSVDADALLGTPALPAQSYDIKEFLDQMQEQLLTAQSVTLDGMPLAVQDLQRLVDALEITATVVLDGMDTGKED